MTTKTDLPTFSYYPTQEIKLNGDILLLEPYRVIEIEKYVAPMEDANVDLSEMISKLQLITGMPFEEMDALLKSNKPLPEELDPEKIIKLTEMARTINKLRFKMIKISYDLAQLGLKRAKYPEAHDLIGEQLRQFPDVGINEGYISTICGIMVKLANENIPQVADTKKALKENLQEKSGRNLKNGS